MWTVPNLLTLARIVAVVPLVICIAQGWSVAAFAVFIVASLTDFFDGWIARRWNLQSEFGRFLDPLADKLIVAGALIALVPFDAVNGPVLYCALAIISREIAVAGLREFLGPKGIVVHVSRVAKWKTATQMVAVAAILWASVLEQPNPGEGRGVLSATLGLALLMLSAVLAWVSAWGYLRAALPVMQRP